MPQQLAAEEGEYYTWVDEQGRVHNVPLPSNTASKLNKKPAKTASQPESSKPNDSSLTQSTDAEQYLTEEEVNQKLEEYDKDNPSFYIWVDEKGRVQTQTTDQEAEQAAQAEAKQSERGVIVGHHFLARPFRVDQKIKDAACCEEYASQVVEVPRPYKSKEFFHLQRNWPFYTQSGNKHAWYFRVGDARSTEADDQRSRFVVLNVRGAQAKYSLIALDKAMQPLYFIPEVLFDSHSETWKSVAYQQTLMAVEDPEVANFILYLNFTPAETMSLEVVWAHAEYPL